MAYHHCNATMDHRPRPLPRDLVALAWWLRLAYVGASGVAIGIIGLLSRESALHSSTLLGIAVGGGILAVLAWRRCTTLLERLDRRAATAPAVPVPVALLSRRDVVTFGGQALESS